MKGRDRPLGCNPGYSARPNATQATAGLSSAIIGEDNGWFQCGSTGVRNQSAVSIESAKARKGSTAMRHICSAVTLVAIIMLTGCRDEAPATDRNSRATATYSRPATDLPAIELTLLDGSKLDLSAMQGKYVLLDFWATWCGPCRAEMPSVVKLYQDKHADGFEIIGISFDTDKQKVVAYTKEAGMTWPQYFDGKGWENDLGRKYGISSIPTTFLVDKKGVLRVINLRGKKLAERVDVLLKEKVEGPPKSVGR